MYHYWGFGLCIQSEIEFPELLHTDFVKADLTIRFGAMPPIVNGWSYEGGQTAYTISDDEYFFYIKDIAAYYAGGGKEIVVTPYTTTDLRSIRIFILGSVMTAILLQRGMMPLHVSAVLRNEKLILFAGNSGAGKSTTIAQLKIKGYQVFTDDICVLTSKYLDGKQQLSAYASYPMMKLWKDSARRLNHSGYNKEDFNVREGYDKYGHFFFDDFDIKDHPIEKIFILTKDKMPEGTYYERIDGIAAFKELEVAIFRKHQMHNNAIRALYFKMITKLIADCPVYKINMQSGYENSKDYKMFPVQLIEGSVLEQKKQ